MGRKKKRESGVPVFDVDGDVLVSVNPNGATDIEIPDGVEEVASFAFSDGCEDVTSVTLADSVKILHSRCFFKCGKLRRLDIGDGLEEMYSPVFSYINALEEIGLSAGNTHYSLTNGSLGAGLLVENATGLIVLGINGTDVVDERREVHIPAMVDQVTVKGIGDCAFAYCQGIEVVQMPFALQSVGAFAFCGCKALTVAALPNTLSRIGQGAFVDCDSLRTVRLDGFEEQQIGTVAIGAKAFGGDRELYTFFIEEYASYADGRLGESIFDKSPHVTVLVEAAEIRNNIKAVFPPFTNIQAGMAKAVVQFFDKNGIPYTPPEPVDVYYGGYFGKLPDGPEETGYTFKEWTWNGNPVTPNTVVEWQTDDPSAEQPVINLIATYKANTYTVTWRRGLVVNGNFEVDEASIRIQEVEYGTALELEAEQWEDYTLQAWMKRIGDEVTPILDQTYYFYDAQNITIDAYYKDTSLMWNVKSIRLGDGTLGWEIRYATEAPSDDTTKAIVFPAQLRRQLSSGIWVTRNVIRIGDNFFAETKRRVRTWDETTVESIQFPMYLREIGKLAFSSSSDPYSPSWISGITSLVIPESVTAIATGYESDENQNQVRIGAFWSWTGLTYLKAPEAVLAMKVKEVIPSSNISQVEFYPSTSSIPASAFENCTAIESVNLSNTVVVSIGDNAFLRASSLQEITFPATLQSIGDVAFVGTNLLSLSLPEGLQTIGRRAFDACTTLSTVTIPSTVSVIGDEAFRALINVESIVFATGDVSQEAVPLTLGDLAFAQAWSKLKELILPSRIKSVGLGAFREAFALEKLVIQTNLDNQNTTLESLFYYSIAEYAFDEPSVFRQATITVSQRFSGWCSHPLIPYDTCPIERAFYDHTEAYQHSWGSPNDSTPCPANQLYSFNFADDVICIGAQAVPPMLNVHEITIPPNVISIENAAINTTLTDIWFKGECPTSLPSVMPAGLFENGIQFSNLKFHIPVDPKDYNLPHESYRQYIANGQIWGRDFELWTPS